LFTRLCRPFSFIFLHFLLFLTDGVIFVVFNDVFLRVFLCILLRVVFILYYLGFEILPVKYHLSHTLFHGDYLFRGVLIVLCKSGSNNALNFNSSILNIM
jgi:hypothetical protein